MHVHMHMGVVEFFITEISPMKSKGGRITASEPFQWPPVRELQCKTL